MKMSMSRAAGGTAKAILATMLLAVAAPAAVRAETPATVGANSHQAAVLTPTYLDCGTYYVFVSVCMGKQKDAYVEIGKALWPRGRDTARDRFNRAGSKAGHQGPRLERITVTHKFEITGYDDRRNNRYNRYVSYF